MTWDIDVFWAGFLAGSAKAGRGDAFLAEREFWNAGNLEGIELNDGFWSRLGRSQCMGGHTKCTGVDIDRFDRSSDDCIGEKARQTLLKAHDRLVRE